MTTNQPPRKRTLMEVLVDVEDGTLTADEAKIEIEANEESVQP